jgi:hypothetical protein
MSCTEDEIVVPASGAIQSQRVSFARVHPILCSSCVENNRHSIANRFNESIRTVVEWFDLLT